MADQFRLPLEPRFPPIPPSFPPDLRAWAQTQQDAVRDYLRIVADRTENLVTMGPIADRPAANGSLRFYFADDESPPVLYFDDGTWNATNAT